MYRISGMNLSKRIFFNSISRDIQNLNGSVSEKINLNCDPNDVVSEFSHFIADRANVFFENSYKLKSRISFDQSSKSNRNKWFNEECMRKREAYKTAVFEFNLNKNEDTRRTMYNRKKDYKYYCRSCTR